jgi:hypothetical protein
MPSLLRRLNDEPFTLMVSLPRNDVRLAEAALRGGAQGLKVHINVEHFASGTRFGSFDEEQENIGRILEAATARDVAVGVVPGGSPFATKDEFEKLAALGVDFFDAYPAEAPPWTLTQKHLEVMLAAYAGGSVETMMALEGCGMQMCEASMMPHEEYGRDLTALDIARYSELAKALEGPIIVPSQKKITPADVPALQESGAKGLLIGAIVTGREADTIEAATRAFVDALNA